MSEDQPLQELSFSVSGIIAKARTQVYEAVADPEQLSHYFTTGGAKGRLEVGSEVTWDFHDFPGAFEVRVIDVEAPNYLVVGWQGANTSSEDGWNTVRFDFESLEESTRTKVTITETGWQVDADGAKAAFGNCEGWTGMLAAMKAWLEYGINLRDGFYK